MRYVDPLDDSQLLSVTPMGTMKATSPAGLKHVSAWLAILALFAAPGSMGAMPRAERHEVRHEIEHLEKAWCTAVLNVNIPAMDALLSDDYMAITPNGILQSKEQALASMRSGSMHITSIDLSDRKIRLYGKTALVTSRAEVSGTGPDGNMSGSYRYTRVYVKDARGVWRIVSFEASRIREPEERHSAKAE